MPEHTLGLQASHLPQALYNDSVCNVGKNSAVSGALCNGSAVNWPPQIANDLQNTGFTPTTTCAGQSAELVPIYLSTYSQCTGVYKADSSIGGCAWSSIVPFNPTNIFAAPTGKGDIHHGANICGGSSTGCSAPGGNPNFKLVFDPSYMVGGTGNNSCGLLGIPLTWFGNHT